MSSPPFFSSVCVIVMYSLGFPWYFLPFRAVVMWECITSDACVTSSFILVSTIHVVEMRIGPNSNRTTRTRFNFWTELDLTLHKKYVELEPHRAITCGRTWTEPVRLWVSVRSFDFFKLYLTGCWNTDHKSVPERIMIRGQHWILHALLLPAPYFDCFYV